ncbi:MAG: DUF1697 domain-containing protein [Nitrolancea sp.]
MSATTYVALLRGINVGGHNIKMEKLRGIFSEMGFANVRSYIQSGNVFFESDAERAGLRATIEEGLRDALGYAVPTCLRTIDELETVLARKPFEGIEVTPDMRLSVTFFAEPVSAELPVPFRTPDGAYEVVDRTQSEVFVVWYLQNGRPGNSYGLIEKKLGVPGTTRFWHTSAKILAAAKAPAK